MAVLSQNVAVDVLNAMGLPVERCMSLTLEFEPSSIVTAKVIYAVEADQIGEVCTILKRRRYLDEPDGVQGL